MAGAATAPAATPAAALLRNDLRCMGSSSVVEWRNRFCSILYFFPASGKVLVKRLGSLRNDTLEQREREYRAELERRRSGEVEIFGRR